MISNEEIKRELEDKKIRFIKGLGSRIRTIRLHNKLTQAEFATAFCINREALLKIENGELGPCGKLLYVLESCLAVNGTWLMTGDGEMFEEEIRSEEVESPTRFLKMFNRLSKSGKGRMLNVLIVFLKSEYSERHGKV